MVVIIISGPESYFLNFSHFYYKIYVW